MTEYFDMSLTFDDIEIMKEIIQVGIDSRLEGFTQSHFKYEHSQDTYGVLRLQCQIHPDEMSILLRRLEELADNENNENAYFLVNDIIQVYYGKEIM